MAFLPEKAASVPTSGDGDSEAEAVNQRIAQNAVVTCDSGAVDQTRLTTCFHDSATQSVAGSPPTLSLESPVHDRVQFGQLSRKPASNRNRELPEFHQLPQAAQEHIRNTCPYFTAYAHLHSEAAQKRARKNDQRQVENGAGCLGPDDHLRAAIAAWLKAHPPADQSELDFAAVADLPKPLPKPASVPTYISSPSAGGINPKHLAEWVEGSGIDPDLAKLCIASVSGDTVLRFLNPQASPDQLQKARKRLDTVLDGGWLCHTLNLDRSASHLGTTTTSWGCFKPDQPRAGWKKDRVTGRYAPKLDKDGRPVPMKYEHPAGVPTQPFFLPFPRHIGERIARSNRCLAAYRSWEDEAERTTVDRWHWFLKRGCTVWITEGAKKTAALLTAGKLAIGLSGIWNGCTKRDNGKSYLKPQLRFALSLGVRRVFAAFDWAEPGSQGETDVCGAVDRLCRVIGWDVNRSIERFVIDLPGPYKGVDDILVAKGIDGINDLKLHCLPFRRWQAKQQQKKIQQRIRQPIRLDETGRAVRTVDRRYLSADDINPDARLLGLISPMETGKTAALVAYAERSRLPVFIPLHRRSLAGNVAERFTLPYQSEGKLIRPWLTGRDREINLPPPNADYRRFGTEIEAQRAAEAHGKVVVLDSSHADGSSHLDPESCRDALVILDEWDASAMHLLSGTTEIAKARTEVLANFTACLRNARQVIVASAHLHEAVIAYLETLLETKAHLLFNTFRPAEGRTCTIYDKDSAWLEALTSHLQRGQNAYISCTSQKADSVYAASNLAGYISDNLKIPASDILVVDSETTRTTGHPARGVLANPAELLRYRVVIATPVIETGVSIVDSQQHFDSVWAINSGKTSPQACTQSLGRVRSAAPRHLFVARNGASLFGGGITADELQRKAGTAAAILRDSLYRAGIDAELPASTIHTEAWAAIIADHNLLAKEHDFATRLLIQTEGYTVSDTVAADDEVAQTCRDQLKEAGQTNNTRQCLEVSQTAPAEQDEIEDLEKKSELTVAQQRALEHAKIARDFGVETASPVDVEAHRRRAYNAFRLELMLREMQRGIAETSRMLDALTAMKRPGVVKKGFIGDFLRAWQQPRVALLHQIGALALVDRRDEFTMADADLVAIHERAQQERDLCRQHLGVDPAACRASTFLKELADRLGYKLQRLEQRRMVDGKNQHLWIVQDAFPGVDRHQIQRHIADNVQRRYDQAIEDSIGPDASRFVPPDTAAIAATAQGYDLGQHEAEWLAELDW